MYYFLEAIESWQGGIFSVRNYCVREQRQESLRFPSATATVSLRKFSRTSKIWVSRSCCRLHTCLMPTHGRSCKLHEKRPTLPKKLKELHKREKN